MTVTSGSGAGKARWYIVLLFCLYPLTWIFNADFAVIPFFKYLGYRGWTLYAITTPIALAELCYTYYCSGITDQIRKIKVCERGVHYVVKKLQASSRISKSLEAFGYFGIMILGIIVPGGRNSSAIFCRTLNWYKGFIVLLFADLIHVALVIGLLKIFWH